jgi:uroporphyrinogen-III synthase
MKILSTKQLEADIIAAAAQDGMIINCIDFIRIVAVAFDVSVLDSIEYDALIFTSHNAVKYFFKSDHVLSCTVTKPVYALSGKTKEALIEKGVYPTATGDNAAMLAEIIAESVATRSVLHICGNMVLDTVGAQCAEMDIRYGRLIVYETIADSQNVKEKYDGIMFFSPSGIDSYLSENELQNDILYCCIGETTAGYLGSISDKIEIILPGRPTPESMISAISTFKRKENTI